jgi:epoxide hydrolase 4
MQLSGLRDGYADLGAVRLHYVEAGEGPLVVLLHGFPEFWLSWRLQIPALVAAGFRVVAPDMRGYNTSSRPAAVADYRAGLLAGDVRELIAERGERSALLAGHDWGGAVAWAAAIAHPEVVARLAILNAPHPRRFAEGVRQPRQTARSWYMLCFQLPWLPERIARAGNWRFFREACQFRARPGAVGDEEVRRYVEAWSQPGAARGMINYYRAAFRGGPPSPNDARIRQVQAPTRVIWGERDRYLGPELAAPDPADVPNVEVVRLPNATHWVHQDEPDRVNRLLAEFFA